jgi:hypothetical protein
MTTGYVLLTQAVTTIGIISHFTPRPLYDLDD